MACLSYLHARAKVGGDPILLELRHEEQEGMTTTLATMAHTEATIRAVGSHEKESMTFKELHSHIDLTYHELSFITGKDIRVRGDQMILKTNRQT